MRPEWTGLRQTIRAGAEWLTATKQPRGALVSHLGLSNHVGGHLHVHFSASGFYSDPAPRSRPSGVVVFEFSYPEWRPGDGDIVREAPFTAAEIDGFRQLLNEAGLTVIDEWNGEGLVTGSFGIDGRVMSPDTRRVFDRYHKSCPKHETVFCGRGDEVPEWAAAKGWDDYASCRWYSGGVEKLARPNFVAVPYPVGGGGGDEGDDDRNLRAVKEALERITPILAEMGIHPGTVVAGRRGHIEGEEELDFVADAGHGVLLPAEAVIGLVAAAAAALEEDR